MKKSYFLNNPSSDLIRVTELNLTLPPGISNLFELNEELSYEQIDYSAKNGTLRAAMDNGLCYPVPNPINQRSFSDDVIMRKPLQVQVLPSRARFTVVKGPENAVFDSVEDVDLFEDESIKPARELEEDIRRSVENIEKVEATIKQANLAEKPIENRYIAQSVKEPAVQEKLKNDVNMGYVTCNGKTSSGKRCLRRAKTGKEFCGLHAKQE